MKTNALTPELRDRMDAYWRAANYPSVGQIYLFDNPLLQERLIEHERCIDKNGQDLPDIRNWTWRS